MFIKVTQAVEETSVYINVNNIISIEQDGDISIIMTKGNTFFYAKETANDIVQMTNISRMLSVS